MRSIALFVAASALCLALPATAHATPFYCYAAKPGGEAGCAYSPPVAEKVTFVAVGGWRVFVKHKKKVTTITNPTPEVPMTFDLELRKGDSVTMEAFHIGSAIVLIANE